MTARKRQRKATKARRPAQSAGATAPAGDARTTPPADRHAVVCLGASAGGLEALEAFFEALPAATGASYVVVLHLSPDFKSLMPELLSSRTTLPVSAAAHDTVLEPDHIYIIPPRNNMIVRDGRLLLEEQDRTPGHALNLPIDIFLKSLAAECGERAVGIVLSGTGSDGSRGVRAIKDAGGIVFAQEPSSARFDGMPRASLDTGVVDACMPPARLAEHVAAILGRTTGPPPLDAPSDGGEGAVAKILQVIRESFALDLSYLRPTMLARRVQRRMSLIGVATLEEYVAKLQSDLPEARALKQDLLIGVTGFFRDADAFECLRRHLASVVLAKPRGEQMRIWVPACASGEEVYSLAICVAEAIELSGQPREVKIFATDVDDNALAFASKATYPLSRVAEVSPTRLARHFVHNVDSFIVERSLREMVIFAQHNIVTDPPFTKIDLVSCRNVLIYMKQPVQSHVLACMHFALRQGGTLFLGSAETVGPIEDEFDVHDAKHKIFLKSRNVVLPSMHPHSGMRDPISSSRLTAAWRDRDQVDAYRQVVDAMLEQNRRSAVLMTMEGTLIEALADPQRVLRIPKGRPSTDVARMLADELTIPLASGLQRLQRDDDFVQFAADIVEDDEVRHVVLKMRKLPSIGATPERILVEIEPVASVTRSQPVDQLVVDKDASKRIHDLQHDLHQTRESLQATIEELQTSNEEQQSTNEELVASNEELQSTNEELQSVNEELYTVNDEYQKKNHELAVMAADLDNLLRNLDVGTLFLDDKLCIRKFTPAVQRVIKLVDHDIGRPVEHFATSLGVDFLADVERVVETGEPVELEVRSVQGDWILVRINTYTIHPDRREGVVITFVDVTVIKNAQEMTRLSNDQLAHANRELSRQREELEDLFSIVAHDLKRPVVAMNGLLSILRDGDGLEAEKRAALTSRALDECTRVQRMLDDLGYVSGITRQDAEPDEVDLQAWFDEVVGRFTEKAKERGIRINCTCDAGRVRMPRGVLQEACTNLLENAVKYGCTDPRPRIDIACALSDDELVLSVRDNGKGIDPRNHGKIFEPFRRLDPEMAEGSGVGLLAVKRVVSKQGGSIELESAEGKGAKFTIRLPMLAGSADGPARASHKPSVLLVEDDALDAKVVQRYLRDDYGVTRTKCVAEAESKLTQGHFDLVLLDLSLPDGHGLELVRRFRTDLDLDIPVIIISGHAEGVIPEAISETIDGCLFKSGLTRASLRTAVAGAIAEHRTRSAVLA